MPLASHSFLFLLRASSLLRSPLSPLLYPNAAMDDSAHGGAAFADSEGLSTKGETVKCGRTNTDVGARRLAPKSGPVHPHTALKTPPIMHDGAPRRNSSGLPILLRPNCHRLGQANKIALAATARSRAAAGCAIKRPVAAVAACRCSNRGRKRWGKAAAGGAASTRRFFGSTSSGRGSPGRCPLFAVIFLRIAPLPPPPPIHQPATPSLFLL